jgi:hypothetical protein
VPTDQSPIMKGTARWRRLTAAVICAATVGGGGIAMSMLTAESAHATVPPKSCVDDPDQDGCPHTPDGGGSDDSWSITDFRFDGTDLFGNFYWSRKDGAHVTDNDAAEMWYVGNFESCKTLWPLSLRLKCH